MFSTPSIIKKTKYEFWLNIKSKIIFMVVRISVLPRKRVTDMPRISKFLAKHRPINYKLVKVYSMFIFSKIGVNIKIQLTAR